MQHVFSYLLYCSYAMFYFLRKLPVPPFKKLTRFRIQAPSFKSNFSNLSQQIFYQNVPPPFWKMECKCLDIAKSAGSQTSKSSKHDSMTAEFCKNIYQKTYLNEFRLSYLFSHICCKKGDYIQKYLEISYIPKILNPMINYNQT